MQYSTTDIADILRKDIILGNYKSGDSLGEVALSKKFDVSRGPVRDALAMLSAERMIEKRSNGRSVVIEYDLKEIRDLYEVRILLETHALQQLDMSLYQKYKGLLHDYLEMMKEADAFEERDIETDLSFHYLLVKMSGNETLMHLWNVQRNIFRTLVDITSEVTLSNQDEIINQHIRLVEALEVQNIDSARRILTAHLNDACEYCCKGKSLL
ncbi:GntR family transcriptional regulator [Salinicoccus sp. Marseille-QA3877]